MRVVIQRVKQASVTIDNNIYNSIENGLLILVGFCKDDTLEDVKYLVSKIVNLRIFNDENDKMNLSIKDINGSILSISQFTLFADTKKGNRPSFINALSYAEANNMYETFNELLNKEIKTYPGIFGSDMKISLINDGTVTIIIDSKEK